jgi:hypothetical protein
VPVFANRNPILSILKSVVPTAGPFIFLVASIIMKSITCDGGSDKSSEDIHSEDNSPEEDCKNDNLYEFMIPMSYKHEKVTSKKHNMFKFYRKLAKPIKLEREGKLKSLLCSLCLKDLQGANCDKHTRKKCLSVDTNNTSNLLKHVKTKHENNKEVEAFLQPQVSAKRKRSETNLELQCSSSNIASMFPKIDSMENLRGQMAKWLYLNGRPLNIIESPNFKAMMTPLVKDYTTMSRDTFNDLIDFEISRFQIQLSKMANEASHNKCGNMFMHLMHDIWTGNDGNNNLGFSCSFIWEMQLIKVKLGHVKNNLSHKAELNATLMEHSLLKHYQFDFSQWCYSIVSDTTSSAVNVAEEFSDDTKEVNCTMHKLNSSLKYGYGLLENTKTRFARNEDGTNAVNTEGNHYKVTSIITPGGEFLDGKHIINALQEIANFFGTSQRLERLRTTQKHWNCPKGRPAYSREIRVSSVHKLLSTSWFHYFTMEKFAMENLDKEAQDYQFHVLWCKLSAVNWCTFQEMEGVSLLPNMHLVRVK